MIPRLRDLGVLPAGATDAELRELAERIAQELRASSDALHGLGGAESGQRAVDDSAYLADLLDATASAARRGKARGDARQAATKAMLELFRRRVGGRVLNLRAGTWTDATYDV